MKLKSLILGSIAAAGLSTAGYAADLGVLTSLDVCDSLGISGLTISSDTNCLQISGGVKYEFYWGDYKDEPVIGTVGLTDGIMGGGIGSGNINIIGAGSGAYNADAGLGDLDWRSKTQAWLKFVGSADSDFGTAKAVLALEFNDRYDVINEGFVKPHGDNPQQDASKLIKEAYVSVGDSTVLMAGKKSTIGNFGDSQPFNFLRTFGYNEVDNGILLEGDEDGFGGHVIQVVSDLGNGVSVGLGLENLDGKDVGVGGAAATRGTRSAGTLVGVVSYAGEAVTAHLTGFAGGILDGETDFYGLHAGATGTFEQFKVRAALGYLQNEVLDDSKLHALLSAEAGFDMFTVALSGEYVDAYGIEGYGLGGSIGATITDGIKINLGSRWYRNDTADTDTVQVAAQLIAAVTETIEVTGEVGGYFGNGVELSSLNTDSVGYGALGLKWAPGGGFTSSLKGEATTESAYKVSFTAEKTFD